MSRPASIGPNGLWSGGVVEEVRRREGAGGEARESGATGAVLDSLFEETAAEKITITVRKETPVLDGIVDSVGVELTRTRDGRPV